MNIDKNAIRHGALELIDADPRRVAARLMARFGLSRQVANGYLARLTREGLIEAEGSTRARVYGLCTVARTERDYPREGLDEHRVWYEDIAASVASYPDNVRYIWEYTSTEMINNAVDHSGAETVAVAVQANALFTEIVVTDDGEGIFVKIQRALSLEDPREAILELAKGKLTTAPENHTGEGIFFTSRLHDLFEIRSRGLLFHHGEQTRDALVENGGAVPGTRVRMRLANDSARTAESVFDAYTDPEELTFDKTLVPMRLAQHEGQHLVSRSQAKRIAHRLEKFKRVELDFSGVSIIGQGFADELFRVFAAAHPEVRLIPVNTVPVVAKMVRRALAAASNRE